MTEEKSSQTHFITTFWYIVGISSVIFLYVVAVTFLPIPEKNIRFVDISFGFLLNLVAQGINYLTGGSPSLTNKKDVSNNEQPKSE